MDILHVEHYTFSYLGSRYIFNICGTTPFIVNLSPVNQYSDSDLKLLCRTILYLVLGKTMT